MKTEDYEDKRRKWKEELITLAFVMFKEGKGTDVLISFHKALSWMKDKDKIADSFADTYMKIEDSK